MRASRSRGERGARGLPPSKRRSEPASPPPALGADTDQVLAELGYSKSEIEELAREQVI
jgi:crotonobetainyl-CoA:carnitine CoA-transferase CaiB-like acyl-CoA transferase